MHSLEGDKMTANATSSNSIPNWATFVIKVFWLDVFYFGKWQNDCFATKVQLHSHFLYDILK